MSPLVHRAAAPTRTFFDPWNSSSTSHQTAKNRLSGSTSWRESRGAKLQEQFSSDEGGGRRMYDAVGAGSLHFGRDGRTEVGWEDSIRGWRGREGVKEMGDIGAWVMIGGKRNRGMSDGTMEKKMKGQDTRGQETRGQETRGQEMRGQEMEEAICKLTSTREREQDGVFGRRGARAGNIIAASVLEAQSPQLARQDTSAQPPPSTQALPSTRNSFQEPPPSAQPPPSSQPPPPAQPPPSAPLCSSPEPSAGTSSPARDDRATRPPTDSIPPSSKLTSNSITPKPLFANLTIHINGSTHPHISDHRLKHLLAMHGARVALAFGCRSVTHVIVTTPGGGGAGGGLAGGKIEKEIRKRGGGGGGVGTRFVGVEWVLQSIKAGKRLPESQFPAVSTGPTGVKSVRTFFQDGNPPVLGP